MIPPGRSFSRAMAAARHRRPQPAAFRQPAVAWHPAAADKLLHRFLPIAG